MSARTEALLKELAAQKQRYDAAMADLIRLDRTLWEETPAGDRQPARALIVDLLALIDDMAEGIYPLVRALAGATAQERAAIAAEYGRRHEHQWIQEATLASPLVRHVCRCGAAYTETETSPEDPR